MGGPVEMFENLSPKVPGHQRAECAGGRVADEVKVADLLCDDAQSRAGTGGLYLWAEDPTEGHILEMGALLAMAAQTRGGPGGGRHWAGQRFRHHVRRTWYVHQLVGVL